MAITRRVRAISGFKPFRRPHRGPGDWNCRARCRLCRCAVAVIVRNVVVTATSARVDRQVR
jgi:hypothetical protein